MWNLKLHCGMLLGLLLCSGCQQQQDPKAMPSASAQAEMETNKQKMMQGVQNDPKLNPTNANGTTAGGATHQGGAVPGGAGMSSMPSPPTGH